MGLSQPTLNVSNINSALHAFWIQQHSSYTHWRGKQPSISACVKCTTNSRLGKNNPTSMLPWGVSSLCTHRPGPDNDRADAMAACPATHSPDQHELVSHEHIPAGAACFQVFPGAAAHCSVPIATSEEQCSANCWSDEPVLLRTKTFQYTRALPRHTLTHTHTPVW